MSIVNAGFPCPRRSLTTLTGTPALMSRSRGCASYERFFDEQEEFETTIDVDYPEAVAEGRRMSRAEVVDFATEALQSND